MKNTIFMSAAEELEISKSQAYKIIKKLNKQLEEKGYMTIIGKVSRKYFNERFYGMEECQCQ